VGNTIVGRSNDKGNAPFVYCCVFVLKERGAGGDGVGGALTAREVCRTPVEAEEERRGLHDLESVSQKKKKKQGKKKHQQ
jgi:hypothetical protein